MKFKSFLILSFLVSYSLSADSCTCPTSATAPQTIINTSSSSSTSELVVDGVNYGKVGTAGKLNYLKNSVSCDGGYEALDPACPTGFRLPTKEEYKKLLTTLGSKAYSTLKKTFTSSYYYLTSTKTYPSNLDG